MARTPSAAALTATVAPMTRLRVRARPRGDGERGITVTCFLADVRSASGPGDVAVTGRTTTAALVGVAAA
ncbi:hypothetical protein DEJ31_07645 [Curtobacterium sp. MCPF17_031]|nr:hypothetical protein DEJ31_07645 [Curtobacterium sp. MCPF17_031]